MKNFVTAVVVLGLLSAQGIHAQQPQPAAPQTSPPATPPPSGTVLFSTEKGLPTDAKTADTELPEPAPEVRNAPTFTRYDLDVHLTPAEQRITVRSRFSLRNDGAKPLSQLALQLSSSLTWESVAVAGTPVPLAQHLINNDADHTGQAREAIITLPAPLAAGATLELTAFYSGDIARSAQRLERLGAPPVQAAAADWDEIATSLTAVRGFGNVLWYPVAGEPAFLGDGAKLFQAIGKNRERQQAAKVHLRLSVQYIGDPPDAAFFCGRREHLTGVSEDPDMPAAQAPGVATAEFETTTLGFRSPSLFVTDRAATVTNDTLIAAVTDHYDAVPSYANAAALVKPVLAEWLGPQPLTQLTILDHPGQAFEDDALVVAPMRASDAQTLAPGVIHTLAHAWFQSSRAWLDEGVPQLLSILWTEQSQGRDAAIASLQQGANTLALAEPDVSQPASSNPGQSLIAASDDVYFRTKSAAVLWMLRTLAGDDALRQTLILYRRDAKADSDPMGFEQQLEKYSHKDLRWFFDDWVYNDRGLPDLTIVNVTPRELPARGGKSTGWLVSVEVRNDGGAAAEVPVTVRSGTLTATEHLRIPARSSTSTRILFEGTPEEVLVNDGTIPEVRAASHSIQIKPSS